MASMMVPTRARNLETPKELERYWGRPTAPTMAHWKHSAGPTEKPKATTIRTDSSMVPRLDHRMVLRTAPQMAP